MLLRILLPYGCAVNKIAEVTRRFQLLSLPSTLDNLCLSVLALTRLTVSPAVNFVGGSVGLCSFIVVVIVAVHLSLRICIGF